MTSRISQTREIYKKKKKSNGRSGWPRGLDIEHSNAKFRFELECESADFIVLNVVDADED